jgi:hypothetical protein
LQEGDGGGSKEVGHAGLHGLDAQAALAQAPSLQS